MRQETTKPLYKVLNEQRTQGNILNTIDGNLVIENSDKVIGFIVTDSADAQYTALAVNNLASVANALDNILTELSPMFNFDFENAPDYIKQAKEALKNIS